MLDKLSKHPSISDKRSLDYTSLVSSMKTSNFFLFENSLYVLKDEFVHPGGQFIFQKIGRSHITKYYLGIAAIQSLPYRKMIYKHTEAISSDLYKEKVNVYESTLWVDKHPNLVMTTSKWNNNFSWRVSKIMQISKDHVMFHVKPKNVAIEIEEIVKSISNFGKILVCQFKHTSKFKASFLHLSQFDQFINRRKKFYNVILNKFNKDTAFQKVTNKQLGLLIHFNKQKQIDYVRHDIQNKFAKKYLNLVFDDFVEDSGYQDYLPIVVKIKNIRKFFDSLSKKDATNINSNYLHKSNEPVEISSKIKLAIGGPFGFENILYKNKPFVIFVDDDGIFSMEDFSYSILSAISSLLTNEQPDENAKFEKILSMNLHIIFKTRYDKLDTLSEFIMGFYFYEKIAGKGFIKSLFVFKDDELLKKYVADNHYVFATAERNIIIGKYKNSHFFYKQIKKLVQKNKIMFI